MFTYNINNSPYPANWWRELPNFFLHAVPMSSSLTANSKTTAANIQVIGLHFLLQKLPHGRLWEHGATKRYQNRFSASCAHPKYGIISFHSFSQKLFREPILLLVRHYRDTLWGPDIFQDAANTLYHPLPIASVIYLALIILNHSSKTTAYAGMFSIKWATRLRGMVLITHQFYERLPTKLIAKHCIVKRFKPHWQLHLIMQ